MHLENLCKQEWFERSQKAFHLPLSWRDKSGTQNRLWDKFTNICINILYMNTASQASGRYKRNERKNQASYLRDAALYDFFCFPSSNIRSGESAMD